MAAARQEAEPAEEAVREVAPGILRFQLPVAMTGLGHVNAYCGLDRRGACLVDAGVPGDESWGWLLARLGEAGLAVADIHTVVVTHSHPDHYGGAHRLAAQAGARVVTHGAWQTRWGRARPTGPASSGAGHADHDCAAELAGAGAAGAELAGTELAGAELAGAELAGAELADIDPADVPPDDVWTRPTPWGRSSFVAAWLDEHAAGLESPDRGGWLPPEPDQVVADGATLDFAGHRWRCLYTPGHTLDHLCLWDPEGGVLLSGDHVLPSITPHIPGIAGGRDALASYLASLRRVCQLGPVSVVLPAHGQPFSDLAGRVADIEAHHQARLDRLCEIATAIGPAGVTAYSHELFRPQRWGPMAESETYAHLEHLQRAGRLARRGEGAGLTFDRQA